MKKIFPVFTVMVCSLFFSLSPVFGQQDSAKSKYNDNEDEEQNEAVQQGDKGQKEVDPS